MADDSTALNLHLDGSYRPGTGAGGMGMVVVYPEVLKLEDELVQFDGIHSTSPQRTEVHALIESLKWVCEMRLEFNRRFQRILIHTDCTYVDTGLRSIRIWQATGWKRRDGKPLADADLWQEVLRLIQKSRKRVEPRRDQSHGGSKQHVQAHHLARASSTSAEAVPKLFRHADIVRSVRRRHAPGPRRRTPIPMRGQTMRIHIISQRLLRGHTPAIVRYGYEVWDEATQAFTLTSTITAAAEIDIRRGHYYRVEVNIDDDNPKIMTACELTKAELTFPPPIVV